MLHVHLIGVRVKGQKGSQRAPRELTLSHLILSQRIVILSREVSFSCLLSAVSGWLSGKINPPFSEDSAHLACRLVLSALLAPLLHLCLSSALLGQY